MNRKSLITLKSVIKMHWFLNMHLSPLKLKKDTNEVCEWRMFPNFIINLLMLSKLMSQQISFGRIDFLHHGKSNEDIIVCWLLSSFCLWFLLLWYSSYKKCLFGVRVVKWNAQKGTRCQSQKEFQIGMHIFTIKLHLIQLEL